MKRLMIIVAVAVLTPLPGLAQKQMYRCGNNYQDRPCDGAPAAKAAPPAASVAPAAKSAAKAVTPAPAAADAPKAPVAMTKAQQQRQIRCENFGRQRDELRERQKAAPQQADAVGVQIKSLEARMNADSCS